MSEQEGQAEAVAYESLATYLKALSNARRLQVLHFLVRPRSMEEIASELGVARQTAVEHVQQLVELGFVQQGRTRGEHGAITYSLVPQRLFHVHEMLGSLGSLTADLEEQDDFRLPTQLAPTVDKAAPREQELPRLTIVHGMRVGQTTVLGGSGPWLVGRDLHAAICLDYDPYVSARHLEVRRGPNGFEVADLYSSNGSWLDWKRIPRGGVERLDNGGLVRAGKTLILFRWTPGLR